MDKGICPDCPDNPYSGYDYPPPHFTLSPDIFYSCPFYGVLISTFVCNKIENLFMLKYKRTNMCTSGSLSVPWWMRAWKAQNESEEQKYINKFNGVTLTHPSHAQSMVIGMHGRLLIEWIKPLTVGHFYMHLCSYATVLKHFEPSE